MNRFLPLTLVALGGATLFGCKNTVSLNTGGSTATSTHATVTAATGTNVTGTGTTGTQANTTGALAGSSTGSSGMQQCQALCNTDSQLSTQLGCAPQGASCVSGCESLYAMAPQCSSQLDAVISCGQQKASPSTCMCDAQNGNSLKCNVCANEAAAVNMCLQSGTSTGTGMTAGASSSNGGGGG